ncbi:hypothetical protein VQ056_09345 [Paenibacillus sp. JTLBN-2024]
MLRRILQRQLLLNLSRMYASALSSIFVVFCSRSSRICLIASWT